MSKQMIRLANVVLLLTVAVLCLACAGAAAKQRRMNDLKQIGLAYHNFMDQKSKAPAGPQDLLTVSPEAGPAIALIQNNEVVFIWGVKITDMPQGSSSTVIAYETVTPTSGGIVLMGDGSVRQMTAADFKGATLAAPKKGEKEP